MSNRIKIVSVFVILVAAGIAVGGCAAKKPVEPEIVVPPPRSSIGQIDSFNPQIACRQALEVTHNNPYGQEFFEKVFARVVAQCQNSKSQANADIIWDNFVLPLKQSGKVPPDLAKTLWNYYFSRQFVSLPATAPTTHYCQRLGEIKENLEKEFRLKKAGFEICEQGTPDAHFLNAMYVYNTMWAACNGVD